jgi:hypothetical protein
MIALLLVSSSALILALVLLAVVVIGIRQEPTTIELRTNPPGRLARLVRRVLGVSVRKPDTTDDHAPESCLVDSSPSPEGPER